MGSAISDRTSATIAESAMVEAAIRRAAGRSPAPTLRDVRAVTAIIRPTFTETIR